MGKAAEERRLRVPLRYTAHDQHLVAQTPGFGVCGSYARVGDSDIDRVGVGLALPWSGDGKPSPY